MVKRLNYIDVIKGLGIIFVVLGHFPETPNMIKIYLYSFHMPLFFFISGYLFNKEKNNDFKSFFNKKFRSLLIPYFIIELILFGYSILTSKFSGDQLNYFEYITSVIYANKIYDINYISTLWFLACLFITEIIFYLVATFTKNKYSYILPTVFILSLVGYFYSTFTTVRLPYGFEMALVALAFYAFGNYFRNSTLKNKLLSSIKVFSPVFFILNILFLYLNHLISPNKSVDGRVDMLYLEYGNYLLFYLAAISGILFYYLISTSLGRYKLKVINFLGSNSLIIMAFHIQILVIVQKVLYFILNKLGISIDTLVLIPVLITLILVINTVVILLINRFFPFILGKPMIISNKKSETTPHH